MRAVGRTGRVFGPSCGNGVRATLQPGGSSIVARSLCSGRGSHCRGCGDVGGHVTVGNDVIRLRRRHQAIFARSLLLLLLLRIAPRLADCVAGVMAALTTD